MQKARESQKNIFCFTDYAKTFDHVDYNKLENSARDGNISMQVNKQQLEPDMEQWTGYKLGK